jgi:SAM-dependent methyltransferase
MPSKINSPESLMDTVNSYRVSRIILTAHELDVFTHLSGTHLSSAVMAEKTGTDPRAMDRLLNALVSTGLLEKSNSLFSNTELAEKFMVPTSASFLGGLSHQVHLWKTWNSLTEAVKKGSSVTIRESIGKRDETWLKSFMAAMHSRTRQAREVANLLDLSGVHKMLDVGGGSGAFTFAFIRSSKNIKGTIFDLPAIIPITKSYIEKEGFTGSVDTIPGDYHHDDFGKGYDLILVSAVVHINSEEENQALVGKCADALNPGGRLIIIDHIMNDDRTEPAIGAIFAINMLVGTEKGDTYTEAEIRTWMENAGLSDNHLDNTLQETLLMTGKKK